MMATDPLIVLVFRIVTTETTKQEMLMISCFPNGNVTTMAMMDGNMIKYFFEGIQRYGLYDIKAGDGLVSKHRWWSLLTMVVWTKVLGKLNVNCVI